MQVIFHPGLWEFPIRHMPQRSDIPALHPSLSLEAFHEAPYDTDLYGKDIFWYPAGSFYFFQMYPTAPEKYPHINGYSIPPAASDFRMYILRSKCQDSDFHEIKSFFLIQSSIHSIQHFCSVFCLQHIICAALFCHIPAVISTNRCNLILPYGIGLKIFQLVKSINPLSSIPRRVPPNAISLSRKSSMNR